MYDNSLSPRETACKPDFKVSTIEYQVENGQKRLGLGETDQYFYEIESGKRKRKIRIWIL